MHTKRRDNNGQKSNRRNGVLVAKRSNGSRGSLIVPDESEPVIRDGGYNRCRL
ncbi:hypothetical protein AJ78_07118 [Emergomyces pasteurianus Ep9510]|uniref:Uncharacterized protein n=1 Tax=Emergomyces pasteurianus Ep9510 TaxID=1447872 RepID=A0A1J9Q8I7_9EURO|nr:hypothetical protein AJ78_07118 [Emergomyces pasteurianus Ep9510]